MKCEICTLRIIGPNQKKWARNNRDKVVGSTVHHGCYDFWFVYDSKDRIETTQFILKYPGGSKPRQVCAYKHMAQIIQVEEKLAAKQLLKYQTILQGLNESATRFDIPKVW